MTITESADRTTDITDITDTTDTTERAEFDSATHWTGADAAHPMVALARELATAEIINFRSVILSGDSAR